ncbi:TPA: morphogenetic protein [Yersinia enterocolitica]|uniref:morphogenetic protein n=1 Tax=Yersinia enterocolitica TaxID=630 RepID=UPI003308158B|nr:morphogenetic protein [Yersinia enterocolitica]
METTGSTTSKERPILFNAEMVKAILSGRKTQTRRIISEKTLHLFGVAASAGECHPLEMCDDRSQSYYVEFCPLGKSGDQLWVREAFQGPLVGESLLEEYRKNVERFETPKYCEYAADGGSKPEYLDLDDNLRQGWRPSIHMPRWASRINLLITGVRVERLQAITLGNICKEIGCSLYDFIPATYGFQVWEELWKSIYGEESWEANPWVWCITFERMEAK